MDLRQIGYVVAVVDNGGFTKAAAAVPISQPALSQAIRSLEDELGVDLFHRIGRRVVLTAAGEAFLDPARQLLRDADTLRAATAAVAGLESGRLDLVALPTLAVDPLVELLGAFRRAYPGVSIDVAEPEDSGAAVNLIRSGDCEVGLLELPAPSDLRDITLLEQEVLAVCPPDTAVGRGRMQIERLAGQPLVTTPPDTSTRSLVDSALASAGVSPKIAVQTAHREALLPLVLAGAGTTFLPEPLARQAAQRGATVARLSPPLRRTVGLVHRNGPLAPAAEAFIALATGKRRAAELRSKPRALKKRAASGGRSRSGRRADGSGSAPR